MVAHARCRGAHTQCGSARTQCRGARSYSVQKSAEVLKFLIVHCKILELHQSNNLVLSPRTASCKACQKVHYLLYTQLCIFASLNELLCFQVQPFALQFSKRAHLIAKFEQILHSLQIRDQFRQDTRAFSKKNLLLLPPCTSCPLQAS